MKKLLTLSFALIFSLAILNQAQAQQTNEQQTTVQQVEEGDLKIGVGLALGSGIGGFGSSLDNDIGLRADAYYAFTPVIRGGGDFTFYFPKSSGGVDMTVWELNLNGHYIFLQEEEFLVYGLGGLNITGISISSDNFSDSDSEVGLNLGAGVEYGLDFADFFGELKLGGLGGDADQIVLGAGLRFSF